MIYSSPCSYLFFNAFFLFNALLYRWLFLQEVILGLFVHGLQGRDLLFCQGDQFFHFGGR
jgi:hypothetical protein